VDRGGGEVERNRKEGIYLWRLNLDERRTGSLSKEKSNRVLSEEKQVAHTLKTGNDRKSSA